MTRKAKHIGCEHEGCEAKHFGLGYCVKHYGRFKRNGTSAGSPLVKNRGKGHVNQDGYRMLQKDGVRILEHRKVMSEHLGRRLHSYETVHHVNGDRLDNRLENLELWDSRQPSGQRIEDKINWALMILEENGYGVSKLV